MAGGKIDQAALDKLDPHNPANSGAGETGSGGDGGNGSGTSTNPVGDFNNAVNTADVTFDQTNANTETTRVAAVTGVRDTLDAGLATADAEWGTTMDTAGSKLGAALDGIPDFDWQHVRDYVGAVTTARRAAEQGALTAQGGFVTSYYSSLNSYTASIASASVTHAGAYAQATADYYVTTADHTADEAEAAGSSDAAALRAKANAFAAFATSYVSYLTGEAQSAATLAVTGVTTANANALAGINTDVATATSDITTFYNQQVAGAATAPPATPATDANGQPDPTPPTATASLAANINAAKTANTASRTGTYSAFVDLTTRRTTSTTNSYTIQNTNSTGGGGTTGAGGNTNHPNQPQAQATPPGTVVNSPASQNAASPQLIDENNLTLEQKEAIWSMKNEWTDRFCTKQILQQKLDQTTDPSMRTFYQQEIETQKNILRVLEEKMNAVGLSNRIVSQNESIRLQNESNSMLLYITDEQIAEHQEMYYGIAVIAGSAALALTGAEVVVAFYGEAAAAGVALSTAVGEWFGGAGLLLIAGMEGAAGGATGAAVIAAAGEAIIPIGMVIAGDIAIVIGGTLLMELPSQLHHFGTNKSNTYTPEMQKIADKYGLDLDDTWNKELLPHLGRHPNKYHDFVLDGMRRAAREAGKSKQKFLELFEKYVKEPIRQNPDLLRKMGWE